MYPPHHRLDTPPPPSHIRPRPWSPDPEDPLPSAQSLRYQEIPSSITDAHWASAQYQSRRHEASDHSVEALDLADYADMLRDPLSPANMVLHPAQPTPFRPYPEYPPSPPPMRPFSVGSQDSLQAPSLVHSPTLSSASHSYASYASHVPARRPFSVPSPLSHHPSSQTTSRYQPFIPSAIQSPSERALGTHSEIDISHFPAWSRNWYSQQQKQSNKAPPSMEMSQPAFFDPTYVATNAGILPGVPGHFSPYSGMPNPSSDVLPWSEVDPPAYTSPIDGGMKAERMRMLEQEFGTKEANDEDQEEKLVGSVDLKGRMITQGPKKRTAVRLFEGLMSFAVAVTSIYAALAIKPPSSPPPQGKPQTITLYILSAITFTALAYVFCIRPCFSGRRTGPDRSMNGLGPMVLPVQAFPGAQPKKKRRNKSAGQAEPVQVNLIVDPTMFNQGSHGMDREDRELAMDADEYSSAVSSGQTGRRPRRRNVFQALALEEQWKRARKELKWVLLFDITALVAWAVEFGWILVEEKCPVGGFEGWCNMYNVASAGACLLCISFGLSTFFDIKDLHCSRASPRTRT